VITTSVSGQVRPPFDVACAVGLRRIHSAIVLPVLRLIGDSRQLILYLIECARQQVKGLLCGRRSTGETHPLDELLQSKRSIHYRNIAKNLYSLKAIFLIRRMIIEHICATNAGNYRKIKSYPFDYRGHRGADVFDSRLRRLMHEVLKPRVGVWHEMRPKPMAGLELPRRVTRRSCSCGRCSIGFIAGRRRFRIERPIRRGGRVAAS